MKLLVLWKRFLHAETGKRQKQCLTAFDDSGPFKFQRRPDNYGRGGFNENPRVLPIFSAKQ